ncbi:MAG: penicillin-binding protein activator [Deltaproteobacteria bacterium]|nr:penicillin-binding protein activator [Deltaproteobacteria bacterium]
MKRSLALFSLAAFTLACPKATGGQTNAANAQAHAELQAAQEKAKTGDPEAQKELERLQSQYANTDVAADAAFEEAELQFQKKDYAAARDRYRALLQQYPLFSKSDLAKYHLGLSALQLGDAKEALDTIAPLYDHLPADQKPEAAAALSKAAQASHNWGQAVRFLAEGEAGVTDPAARAQIDQQLYDLVDAEVPQLEVAKLAQELQPSSPAYALVLFKLARIDFHLHDWDALKQTLTTLQQNAPNNPFAADAQKLLERAGRRDQVKPNAVGVLLPLSGRYQRFGESALAGIKLALEGSGVELVVKDTKGEPDEAKKAVQELVLDDQVIAVIGPIVSTEAQAAAVDADELGVPIIALSREESLTDRGPYVFRSMLTNSAQARALVNYAADVRGFKSFGVLYPSIPYGQELANDFWDGVLAKGGEVTGAESYAHDQTTFSPIVKRLVGREFLTDRIDYMQQARAINESAMTPYQKKNAFEKLKKGLPPVIDFQALFIPDTAKNVSLIAPALAVEDMVTNGCDKKDMERIGKTMGLKTPQELKQMKTVLLLGANGWDNTEEITQRAGKFVDCSVFVDGFYPGSARPSTGKFVKAFTDSAGHTPDMISAYAFDAGLAVKQLVAKERPQTRDAFRDALGKVKNLPGAGGPVTANGRELEHPLFFITVERHGDDRILKEFDPAAEAAKAGG